MHSISYEQNGIDQRHLRHALGRFATGVAVVTTCSADGKLDALTANSFSALSLDPPLVLWSLGCNAQSMSGFLTSGHFAVNVLAAEQGDLSRRFSVSTQDKFVNLPYSSGLAGCPLLADTLATFECATEKTLPGGDHVIFIGRVHRASYRDGAPLIFHAGQYCTHSPIGGA